MLEKQEASVLIRLARRAISDFFTSKRTKMPEKQFLKQKKGVFVTLETKHGSLRGCIGYPLPSHELGRAVVDNAVSAAFHDPRFPPLKEEEFDKVVIEISVLSVPEKTSLEKIKKGDGVIIEKHGRNALFLQKGRRRNNRETWQERVIPPPGLGQDSKKGRVHETIMPQGMASRKRL